MAAKKKVQRVEEGSEISSTETKETKTNTKARIENGAVVLDGMTDPVSSVVSTENNGVKKTKAAVKDGAVVLTPEETPQDPPKRKRGRPRKVRLEDGVVLLDPPTKEETEE